MIYITTTNWKKYAEDLEHRLALYLEHMSFGRMSKTNYDVQTMISVSDDAQQEFFYDLLKTDITDTVKAGGTFEDVMEYVDSL